MARRRAMGAPDLSATPHQFIHVSLYHVTVTCKAIFRAMVRRVVTATVQAVLFFRDTISIQGNGLVRD